MTKKYVYAQLHISTDLRRRIGAIAKRTNRTLVGVVQMAMDLLEKATPEECAVILAREVGE